MKAGFVLVAIMAALTLVATQLQTQDMDTTGAGMPDSCAVPFSVIPAESADLLGAALHCDQFSSTDLLWLTQPAGISARSTDLTCSKGADLDKSDQGIAFIVWVRSKESFLGKY